MNVKIVLSAGMVGLLLMAPVAHANDCTAEQLTRDKFDRIQIGMSKERVDQLFGCKGEYAYKDMNFSHIQWAAPFPGKPREKFKGATKNAMKNITVKFDSNMTHVIESRNEQWKDFRDFSGGAQPSMEERGFRAKDKGATARTQQAPKAKGFSEEGLPGWTGGGSEKNRNGDSSQNNQTSKPTYSEDGPPVVGGGGSEKSQSNSSNSGNSGNSDVVTVRDVGGKKVININPLNLFSK